MTERRRPGLGVDGSNMAVFLYERSPQLECCFVGFAIRLFGSIVGPMHHAVTAGAGIRASVSVGVGDVSLDARHRGRVVHLGGIKIAQHRVDDV